MCAKIDRYRTALEAGADLALVAGWISETTTIKKTAQARPSLTEAPPQLMTDDQIAAIVDAWADSLACSGKQTRTTVKKIYARIGLAVTYRPGTETVIAEVRSNEINRVPVWCPRLNTGNVQTVVAAAKMTI
jgi:hypothetical protein